MNRARLLASALVLAILFTLGVGGARAHGGKSVTVQPLTAKPGEVITVKGAGLGNKSTIEVRVIGAGVDVDLGEVQADDTGSFTAQFTLPADLKSGSYQIKAIGAESETTQLTVAGGAAASATAPMAEMPVRTRPLGQAIGLIAFFGVLAALGIFFARGATLRETRAH